MQQSINEERFAVWCPEYDQTEEEGSKQILALSAEHAVELWARQEDYESAEYDIVGGRESPVVNVRCNGGRLLSFEVYGEMLASYRAKEL